MDSPLSLQQAMAESNGQPFNPPSAPNLSTHYLNGRPRYEDANMQSILEVMAANRPVSGNAEAYQVFGSVQPYLEEAAQAQRDFEQSSAREAMIFEAEQAELNRSFQQSSAREAMTLRQARRQRAEPGKSR